MDDVRQAHEVFVGAEHNLETAMDLVSAVHELARVEANSSSIEAVAFEACERLRKAADGFEAAGKSFIPDYHQKTSES